MEIKRLEGAVEAILFAMGESVELGQIAKASSRISQLQKNYSII